MSPKVSGPRKNTPVKTARPGTDRSSDRRALSGAGIRRRDLCIFAAWGFEDGLSPDLIMPAVATLFLVLPPPSQWSPGATGG